MPACLERPDIVIKDRSRPEIPFFLFARAHLGIKLYPWQVQILRAVERKRVSAVVCNGGGKSSVVIAALVLGFLYNFPKGRAAITSGSYMQLSKILWPAIEQYRSLPYFHGWTWNEVEIKTPQGGRVLGFSTDDPQRAEGWHEDLPDSPLLYVIDEAKSVPDDLFQGIGRCTPTYYLQISSAGGAQGFFYYSFNKFKSIFWTCKVKSSDCPHITDEQRAVDRVTLDRAIYSAKHSSEFDEDLTGSAIPLRIINTALERQATMHHQAGQRAAFCDFAAGGAENVIALRDGNKVEIVAAWRNPDPTQACREFIEHFKRLKLHASEIFADVGGLGVVMCSNLKNAGWPVNEVNNGSPAEDAEHYANRGSEIWFKAAHMIEFGFDAGRQHIIIPNDKVFIEQATNRRREYDAKQRLKIESKKDLCGPNRNAPSPDRADAVLGAMVCSPSQWNTQRVAQVHLPHNMFASPFVNFSV
jgi:phage terminase large subunit